MLVWVTMTWYGAMLDFNWLIIQLQYIEVDDDLLFFYIKPLILQAMTQPVI